MSRRVPVVDVASDCHPTIDARSAAMPLRAIAVAVEPAFALLPLRSKPRGFGEAGGGDVMRSPYARGLLFAWLAITQACATAAVSSSGHDTVRHAGVRPVNGPYAPAGQRFAASLDQGIDTQTSAHHDKFTARLTEPLRDAEGRVLAPVGALLVGHVHSLGTAASRRVQLRFDAVETLYGASRIDASLDEAQFVRYVPPSDHHYHGPYAGHYGWGDGHSRSPWTPVGGGPSGDHVDPGAPIHLPARARLELRLTRPLLPPGSSIVRH